MLFRNSDPSPFAALYAKDIKKNEFVRFATTVRNNTVYKTYTLIKVYTLGRSQRYKKSRLDLFFYCRLFD